MFLIFIMYMAIKLYAFTQIEISPDWNGIISLENSVSFIHVNF